MNRPPEQFVRVQEDRLLAFAQSCFQAAGLPPDHAAVISRLLVNSDLRGVRSHGTRCVNGYCSTFEKGQLNPAPQVRLLSETAAVATLSGDGTLGYLPMVEAARLAVDKATRTGLGMVTVRHIGHYGSAGHYARLCMEAGCIGFSVQGHVNLGNARGAAKRPQLGYFGNPPISFAIPGGDGPPVVLDAATCILADYQRGPEYDALLAQIPAAFFKSIGYTAVAGLLGGALAGISSQDEILGRWKAAVWGGMVLAIQVDAAVPLADLRQEVDRVVRDVAASYEPLPGYDRALLPGTIEAELEAQYRREGIPYGESEQDSARAASQRLGVALPWD